ncbi:hypothetical protein AHAS_Ahas05G0096800 [Arachis hypogaea]
MVELCTVTLGGKGFSFSSTIFVVVASLAHVCIHTSALDRLSASSSYATSSLKHTIAIPSFLSFSETRALLLVLLNKLLRSPPPVVILEKWLGLQETPGIPCNSACSDSRSVVVLFRILGTAPISPDGKENENLRGEIPKISLGFEVFGQIRISRVSLNWSKAV